jgi:hypothetical protein
MHRLLASRHIDTCVGAFAIALGVFLALCLIVGLANVLIWIGGAL